MLGELAAPLSGSVIFHTAVSDAGIGPTSSNKVDIESSIAPLHGRLPSFRPIFFCRHLI
jgi:hypothetical protein